MGLLISAFEVILYQPLFNALVILYQYLPGYDFGVAVIVLTVLIRIIFYPLMVKSIKAQKVLQQLQPKIQEIQRKYKGNKEKQAKATMELYQKEKINPFGGCLPLLIQLPILIALYRVFWDVKRMGPDQLRYLYGFIPHPGVIDPTFLGIINLAQASIGIALIAGLCQFFQGKMMQPPSLKKSSKEEGMAQFSEMMQKQTVYFFPILTIFILWKLPAAIGLYWIISTLFSVFQQYLILKPGYAESKS